MQVTKKRLAAAVGLALAISAGPVLSATPAAAATLPFGTVNAVGAQSQPSTQRVQTLSAVCAPGQRVLGGGAWLGSSHAVLTELQPIHPAVGQDSFKVTAAADQFGITGSWFIQAYAFCGVVPASLQLEIIPKTNPATSQGTDQAFAPCSSGKFLVGMGGKIDNGAGQVDLGTFPNNSGSLATGAAGFAKEDLDGFAGQYTVTGYAVCLRPTRIFGDIEMVPAQFNTPGGVPNRLATVACPPGKAITGLGGGISTPGTHWQQLAPTTAGQPATAANFGAESSGSAPPTAWPMNAVVFCAS